jgi:hypothetical protein
MQDTLVPVYDRTNKTRLLGHIEPLGGLGDFVNVALMAALPARPWDAPLKDTAMDARKITFHKEWRKRVTRETAISREWVEELIYTTSDKLEDLMMLDRYRFRLPGETPKAAKERRYRSLYS